MNDWQPIETAPRDGKPFLGFGDGTSKTSFWVIWFTKYRGWTSEDYYNINLTHWMPLPEPPQE